MLTGKNKNEDRQIIQREWSRLMEVADENRPGATDAYIKLCEEYELKYNEPHNADSTSAVDL